MFCLFTFASFASCLLLCASCHILFSFCSSLCFLCCILCSLSSFRSLLYPLTGALFLQQISTLQAEVCPQNCPNQTISSAHQILLRSKLHFESRGGFERTQPGPGSAIMAKYLRLTITNVENYKIRRNFLT